MLALVAGLGAALCWAAATLFSSQASRGLDPASTVAWVMLVGCAIVLPLLAATGGGAGLSASSIALLTASGLGNVAGLGLQYTAVRRGKVAIVSAITSTEGAIAAGLSVLTGDGLPVAMIVALSAVTVGVAVVAGGRVDGDRGSGRSAVAYAVPAAALFGMSLFCLGRTGTDVPLVWTMLPARIAGAVLIAAPLAAGRRLRLTRSTAPALVLAGTAEVAGTLLFALGAREQLAIAAVAASQFAALSAVAAYLVLGERLARRQVVGLGAVAIGVAAVAAMRA